MTAEPKIDGRTKAGKALAQKSAPPAPPAPPPAEITDPYTKDWAEGHRLVKAGEPLPANASEAMLEGGRAAQMKPPEPLTAPLPPPKPRDGFEIVDVVEAPSSDPVEWQEPRQAPVRQDPFARPATAETSAAGDYHTRRANDIIRAAYERAEKEITVVRTFLQYPTSVAKRAAFMEFCESLDEIPGPPPPTPHGDKAEDLMCYLADWHPDEFQKKYGTCAAKLARQLLQEIAAR